MSVENLIGDVLSGNFSHAWSRVEDWWANLPPPVKAFINKTETDEGKILTVLAETAAQDIVSSGGLTTASFVSAAKDVGSKLADQNISMAQTDIFAAINLAVSAKQSTGS